MSGARRWLVALANATLLTLAAGAAGRLYHGPLFVELVAGAAVGSTVVSRLLARRPQWIVAPFSVLVMGGYLAFAVWWSARAAGLTGPLRTLAADALRNGGPRLLTALVPIEAQPDTVLVPLLLVWLAGLVAGELAIRSAGSAGSASASPAPAVAPANRPLAALAPPTLVYVAALWYAGPHGSPEPWRVLAYLAVAALSLTGLRLRAAAGLLVYVAVAAAVVPLVVAAAPGGPADPRRGADPPRLDTLDANPLARISGWMQSPNRPLLDATLSAPARLTLAVLTEFDGVTWSAGATYRDAGRLLPGGDDAAGDNTRGNNTGGDKIPADRVDQRITIRELSGRLVPAVATARAVDGIRVALDQDSGTLLRPEGLRPGVSYTVESAVPRPDPNQLAAAEVPAGPSVARFLNTGARVPKDLVDLAGSIAEGLAGGNQRAQALEQFLAEHYTYVTDAPSGHAYPNLRFFLLGARKDGGQRGSSEQFAAAYAVLGRLMGLPTRVVVGFDAAAGTSTVRAGAALAWPEVLFDGGWKRFDPRPPSGTHSRPVEQDYHPKPDPPSPSPSVSPSTLEPRLPSPSPSPSSPPAAESGSHRGRAWPGRLAVSFAGLLVLTPVTLVVGRRAQSRRRRRGTPEKRIQGAWLDVVDALALSGRREAAHETAGDLAAARPDLPPITDLVALVNQVGFAPSPPGEAAAATARAQSRRFVQAARLAAPRWRRLIWHLHPGPLRRR